MKTFADRIIQPLLSEKTTQKSESLNEYALLVDLKMSERGRHRFAMTTRKPWRPLISNPELRCHRSVIVQVAVLSDEPQSLAALCCLTLGHELPCDPWDAEAMKFRLNRDGKTLRVLSGIDLPLKNLDLLWNGSVRSTLRQGIGMLSPAVKAPLELGFGVNAFTGKDMGRQQSNSIG